MPVLLMKLTPAKLSRTAPEPWLVASAYAACSTPSPVALMSPCKSMTETPGWKRTVASSGCPIIVASCAIENELDSMVGVVAGHVDRVNHLRNQEEPPASWRLQTGELRFQVGRLRR